MPKTLRTRISPVELENVLMMSASYSNLNQNRQKENKRYNNYPLIIMLLSLFAILTVFIQNVDGQDYTRWHLPEHATLRLGKGSAGHVTFSPDGKRLYVQSSIGIWKYDAQTGQELDLIPRNPEYDSYKLSPYAEIYLCSSPDNTVQVRNLIDNSVNVTLKGDFSRLRRVAFSPDGNTFAVANEMEIRIWDLRTGEQKATCVGHTDVVQSVAFNNNASILASGSKDKTIILWDVATGEQIHVLNGHTDIVNSLTFSKDGGTLVSSGGWSDKTIRLWDVSSGEQKKILKGHTYEVKDILFVPDGSTLISSSSDGTVLFWDMTPFIDTITAPILAEDVNHQQTKLFPNYPNPFNPETWIPYQLASSTDVKVHIYSSDGRLIRTLELGHQQAGVYQNRNKAAYWNGKNDLGERVASGIYYYTLSAGKFSATRRMVILK